MALKKEELFSSTDRAARVRITPDARGLYRATFDPDAGVELLPAGAPVAFDTSLNLWVPYTQGGANGSNIIAGFVWEESIQIDAADEVLGVIMVKGEVERDDVNTAAVRAELRGAPSEANLDAALSAASLREKGIFVRGLSTAN